MSQRLRLRKRLRNSIMNMTLVEITKARNTIAAQIEAEAERDGMAIRKSNGFRIRGKQPRRDSRSRTRPRAA